MQAINEGQAAESLRLAIKAVSDSSDAGFAEISFDQQALCESGEDNDALCIEYTRLFDLGAKGHHPPCPLNSGVYMESRMHLMEELVRFYNFFGLTLSEQQEREFPDHLLNQMEFMHYLSYWEAKTLSTGDDVDSLRRGQRDFVGRHITRWIPLLGAKIFKAGGSPFYREATAVLERFVLEDLRTLADQVGPINNTAVSPQAYSAGRII